MPPISQETFAILGLSVGLFAAFRGLRHDLRAAAEDRAAIRNDLHSLGERVTALGERVARIEGVLPFRADRGGKQTEPAR